ncbi:Helicase sen1 [Frankliniella fusca]|uniref:Helicase sen1 n=1 Tax=Frankliniella fusca TaxID=407009 RepID=A0AAE1HU91_9NEOP|nr:Helicase sen1 [Frankliniella fusca]
MGWFLLRKPYPGLTEQQRININSEELHVGRGRECSVHCLSMYVSRKHLKIIPKNDGNVCLVDLGSSNGTFVNQAKITPGEEFTLQVGDEIGIGNINCDSKDCFVYVAQQEGGKDNLIESSNERINQSVNPQIESSSGNKESENVQGNDKSPGGRHSLERGLKRFAMEPEIVILDDDDIFLEKSEEISSKKAKVDQVLNPNDSKTNDTADDMLVQKDGAECDTILKANLDAKRNFTEHDSSLTMEVAVNLSIPEDRPHAAEHKIKLSSPEIGGEMFPPPPPPAAKTTPGRFSLEGSFSKPKHPRLSSLMEDKSDMSSVTIKLSSPSVSRGALSSSACSTPNTSMQANVEDAAPVQTSTPCVVKTLPAQNNGGWSPIIKDSSGHSQDSSANYTLDEEMIPINLSDDEDDEIFPCSQLFAEDDDVKPDIENIQHKDNIVDLSNDEEPQENKLSDNNELDDVVLISSDEDEDEDDLQNADKWYMLLSQSLVKKEPVDEDNFVSEVDKNHEEQEESVSHKVKVHSKSKEEHDGFDFPDEEDEPKEPEKIRHEKKRDIDDNDEFDFPDEEDEPKEPEKIKHEKKRDADYNDEFKKICKERDSDGGKVQKSSKAEGKEEVKETAKEKEPKEKKSRSERDKSSQKEKDRKHSERKEKKGHKSGGSDKHRPHSRSHERKKQEKDKNKQTPSTKLKEIFPDSDEEDNIESFQESLDKQSSKSPPPPENLPSHGENQIKVQEVQLTLVRLEDDPKLNASCASSSSPLQNKKSTRQIELVDALPLPPRRAINRGISSSIALKMFEGDKQKPVDSKGKKAAQPKDKKTLRRERLAEVAAQNTSKDKVNSEAKRSAPAKIKITTSNRGSFLVDKDDSLPASRPKSRLDLSSIKIPKRKDNVTPILPTKSPLQDMNMSWEKRKPDDISAPASVEPIEIPTGPQPKKRVAQVPPPGFYGDSSTRPYQALPPAPNKSCLSGSSIHNIALNVAKPYPVKKKRVAFKENLVEIFEIERLPNTRPVSSSMDADRPIPRPVSSFMNGDGPNSMRQVSLVAPAKSSVMPPDELILQDVIYDISKWNPLWLKEQKNLPSDVLPPVVSNMDLTSVPKTEFLDFREYHNTMYPLLMLELWNGVSKEYSSNESRTNMLMAVDNATSSPVYLRPDRMLTTLNCHMVVSQRNSLGHPRLGNLVVIDLALKDSGGKTNVIPVFGYVSFDTMDPLRKTDQVHKDLVAHCPPNDLGFKVRFSLMMRERKNCTFVLDKVMRIKNVKYIRGDLRVFQAMKNLEYMPLLYSIISPSAANEDFTLPEISSGLAFPEQLNDTQETVVLKTAAACQEDKPKICLIQGPPGTGKSHVIASLVMQLLYRDGIYSKTNREKGLVPRILLCAPSNNAIDLLVLRLLRKRAKLDKQLRFKMVRVGQPQFMQPDVKRVSLQELAKADVVKQDQIVQHSIDIECLKAKLKTVENQMQDLKMNKKDIPQDLTFRQADIIRRLKVLEDRSKKQSQHVHGDSRRTFAIEREASRKILRGADIVATTLNSCMIRIMEHVFPPVSKGKYHFQVCIVDEATQCLEVETLIPLLLGVKTLVLVGDPNQLPATILSKVAREKGLGTSLFARLQEIFPQAPQLLDTQYRMHPEILRWPNEYFYKGLLKTPDSLSTCRMSKVIPYAVLSLPFQQDRQGEVNVDEAKLVVQLAQVLLDRKAIPQSGFKVGIVTPYQSQRRTIHSLLQERPIRDFVEVNTIDSFQGQEKDVTIISCVRTKGIGFLSDQQRLNVALTRAKYAEFICGNFSSLDRDQMWNSLTTDAKQRKCFHEIRSHCQDDELWNYVFQKH